MNEMTITITSSNLTHAFISAIGSIPERELKYEMAITDYVGCLKPFFYQVVQPQIFVLSAEHRALNIIK